ncbi:MAG TPA: PfkB family carbohydrate kinase [Solirubrobacteraceae bacterium]|nr:PfkB family carbohydrate kinase [Solirubrobacteraceae bacterium]
MVYGRVGFDYTTVGHVTLDVMGDGLRRPGGSAFYSALQAARLGRRALIMTRGVGSEIEELLAPYSDELTVELEEASCTTSFATSGIGRERAQRMLAWAGEIEAEPVLDTQVLHLAPVARETRPGWRGEARLVGITPQGLLRTWTGPGERVVLAPLSHEQLPKRCDAAVLNALERPFCDVLWQRTTTIAVTDEGAPTELRVPSEEPVLIEVPHVAQMRDDMGAGDVFAAAFFIALAEGKDARGATAFANAAAAVRLSGEGPDAVGDRTAIEARMHTVG